MNKSENRSSLNIWIIRVGFLLLLSIFASISTLTKAIDAPFEVNITRFPSSGDADTKMILIIRTSPLQSAGSWHTYVYWDDKLIIDKSFDIFVSKDLWKHTWEFQITPTGSRGTHYIDIWVIDNYGNAVSKITTFKLTKSAPPPEWWNDLPEEFIDLVTGPKGIQGEPGIQGLKGDEGDQGKTGSRGTKGDTGERGERGQAGKDGATGSTGLRGETGKDAPTGLLYISLGLSVFSVVLFFIFIRRNR